MILGIASILLAFMLLFTILAFGDIADGEVEWWEPGLAFLFFVVAMTVLGLLLWVPVSMLQYGFSCIVGSPS